MREHQKIGMKLRDNDGMTEGWNEGTTDRGTLELGGNDEQWYDRTIDTTSALFKNLVAEVVSLYGYNFGLPHTLLY